jgi:hypothetical protein
MRLHSRKTEKKAGAFCTRVVALSTCTSRTSKSIRGEGEGAGEGKPPDRSRYLAVDGGPAQFCVNAGSIGKVKPLHLSSCPRLLLVGRANLS